MRGLEIPKKRWDIALHTAAGGLIGAPEPYVHDVGLRLDFRITKSMSVGAYIAYINTPSRAGRGGNIYGYLQFENRLRFSALNGMSIPLRIGVGLLPFNGPLIRFAAGLNFPLSDSFEFGVDIFNSHGLLSSESNIVDVHDRIRTHLPGSESGQNQRAP